MQVSGTVDNTQETDDIGSNPTAPELGNEPVIVMHNDDDAEASSTSVIDEMEESVISDLDLHDVAVIRTSSPQPVDKDGFEIPSRYAKRAGIPRSGRTSPFGSPNRYELLPIDIKIEEKSFDWSESNEDDDLPSLHDCKQLISHAAKTCKKNKDKSLPEISSTGSLEDELRAYIENNEAMDILSNRMRIINEQRKSGLTSDSSSEESDNEYQISRLESNFQSPPKRLTIKDNTTRRRRGSRKSQKNRSLIGPTTPTLQLNAVVEELPDEDESDSDQDNGYPSNIPYLKKGKFKAFSDMEEERSTLTEDEALHEQLKADWLYAQELQERIAHEEKRAARLKKKAKQMAEKIKSAKTQTHTRKEKPKDKSKAVDPGNQTRRSQSKTPLGLGTGVGRASTRLPKQSGLRRAMTGDDDDGDGPSSPSSSSSESESSSSSSSSDTGTESESLTPKQKRNHKRKERERRKKRKHTPEDPSDSSSSDSSSGDDFFKKEPPSDHSSDDTVKRAKNRRKRQRHRAKLNALKYHQSFLKTDPPFKYSGEIQASVYKKWCRELRDWIKDGRLSQKRGVRLSGKYMTGKAYKFFEQEVLQNNKYTTLTEYFEGLFDYIFPADFRMQQRDKFDAYQQRDMPALDYIRRLQDFADTVGDLDDSDVVLAFWRRCQPYIRAELVRSGFEPSELTVNELESLVTRIERAEKASKETKRPTGRSDKPERHNNPSQPKPNRFKKRSYQSTKSNVDGDHDKEDKPGSSSNRPRNDNRNRDRKKYSSGFKRDYRNNDKDRQKIEKYREEGRCFNCGSTEHISRNCPDRQNKKPPGVSLHSIGVTPTEAKLAAMAEGTKFGLFSIGGIPNLMEIVETTPLDEFENAEREVLWARALYQLYNAAPLAFDMQPHHLGSPLDENRFIMSIDGDTHNWVLEDRHTSTIFDFTREQFQDPEFDVVRYINEAHAAIFNQNIQNEMRNVSPERRSSQDLINEYMLTHELRLESIEYSEDNSEDDSENIPPLGRLNEPSDDSSLPELQTISDSSGGDSEDNDSFDDGYDDEPESNIFQTYSPYDDADEANEISNLESFNSGDPYADLEDDDDDDNGVLEIFWDDIPESLATEWANSDNPEIPLDWDNLPSYIQARLLTRISNPYSWINDEDEMPTSTVTDENIDPSSYREMSFVLQTFNPQGQIVQMSIPARIHFNRPHNVCDDREPPTRDNNPLGEGGSGIPVTDDVEESQDSPEGEILQNFALTPIEESTVKNEHKRSLERWLHLLSERLDLSEDDLLAKQPNGLGINLTSEGRLPRPRKRTPPPWEEFDPTGITQQHDTEEEEYLLEKQREWDQGPYEFEQTLLTPREKETIEVSSVGVRQMRPKNYAPPDIVALERNAAKVKGFDRICPKPLVVATKINGRTCRALLDTGSLSDFMSTTLADQLKLELTTLDKPINLQLAVSGSRSRVKVQTCPEFEYQDIKEKRTFDVINLESYDLILGTPFLFQHKMQLGFNPSQVTVRSNECLPISGTQVLTLESRATEIAKSKIDSMRDELIEYAKPICKEAIETPLPPLRAINHTIPLIDENKVYAWRPSKCPEQMKPLWRAKREDYVRTGRWEFRTGHNAMPMLMLKKPSKDGILRIRSAIDTRERNANTKKMASPLPDIEDILRNVASHPCRSLLDGKDAYEQIRVEPTDVHKTLFTTPEGTMVSHVMQMGDCNASATYQSVMNYVFADYIGTFMDVYQDDTVIYSDTPEEHVVHVKKVIDRLREHKFYLSEHKLQFFKPELKLLGHVIDSQGIRMDPDKVDTITNWKTPTNKGLLASFIGSVGYLAPGCMGVRIPMQALSKVAAPLTPWKWTDTEARAFDEVKQIVNQWRNTRRKTINYSPGAQPINLCCDASLTGGSGVLSQGTDYKTAEIVAFWSGKFGSAQQNYPVHELELLAIVESLKRFSHLLQGVKFRIYTDHKGLEWITTQKKLSPRQARWLEVLADFDFEIIHVPGEMNQLADSLSRIYSDEPKGVVRAASEYVTAEEEHTPSELILNLVSAPLYTGESIFLGVTTRAAAKGIPPMQRLPPRTKRSKKGSSKAIPTDSDPLERLEGENRYEKLVRVLKTVNAQPKTVSEVGNTAQPTQTEEREMEPEKLDEISNHESIREPENSAEDVLFENPVTLTEVITAGDPTIDIHRSIAGRYSEDPFFTLILQKPKDYKNFELSNDLVFLKDNDRRILCIPDIKMNGRRIREILISHAHSILAHLGPRKTSTYLRENVWWKGLNGDVEAFCDTCQTCSTSKPTNHRPYGLLSTLEIPTRPWETMGIDFVGPLPESKNLNGTFDMIMVAICHLTSMVHLAPIQQTYRAKDIAEVVFDRIYKHHGMPSHIVSDRDSLFTSTFWQKLNELTNTELRISSSYHPQTDGATERANRTMTQMLRQCVSPDQKDWVKKLPAIEFAMNSASSSTTGYPPFVLNYGRMPKSMIWGQDTEYPGVKKFAQQMKDAILTAHDAILTARVKQTRLANSRRKEAPFVQGDLVYLSTANLSLPKGRARKLSPKFIGPFKILQDYRNNTFKLDLPAELKQRGVHPAFHANLLRIHVPNDDRRFPGRQIDQITSLGNSEEWAVAEIETHQGKGTEALFKLIWKSGDHAWLPHHEISHLEVVNQYLEAQGVTSVSQLPKRLNANADLPVNAITMALKDLSEEIIDDAMFYSQHGVLPKLRKPTRSRKYKNASKKSPRPTHNHIPNMSVDESNVAHLQAFAEVLRSGQYNPAFHKVPLGYAEFSVMMHGSDPEIPLAPGVLYLPNYDAEGNQFYTLAHQTVPTPSFNSNTTASAGPSAGPSNGPRNQPQAGGPSRRERRNQKMHQKKQNKRRGGGGGHFNLQRALLERFNLDTRSKDADLVHHRKFQQRHNREENARLRRIERGDRKDEAVRTVGELHRVVDNAISNVGDNGLTTQQVNHIIGHALNGDWPDSHSMRSNTLDSTPGSPYPATDAGTYAGIEELFPDISAVTNDGNVNTADNLPVVNPTATDYATDAADQSYTADVEQDTELEQDVVMIETTDADGTVATFSISSRTFHLIIFLNVLQVMLILLLLLTMLKESRI